MPNFLMLNESCQYLKNLYWLVEDVQETSLA